jgi:hypothetical protein
MPSELEYALIAANVVAYVLIGVALLRRQEKLPKDVKLEQAFTILEKSIDRSYPDLQRGYTWKEVMAILKSAKPKIGEIDWIDLENTLKRYEAFRYGGVNYENVDPHSVLRLAQKLQRRERVVS